LHIKRGRILQPYDEHSNLSPKCPWEREKSCLDLGSLEPPSKGVLGNVEGVEDEDMVVVLGEGDHVTLARDLQTTTAGDLDMGALKLCK